MKNKLVLQGKLEIKNAHIVIDGIDLANVLEHGSSVFMVVEPLPESKPKWPEYLKPPEDCSDAVTKADIQVLGEFKPEPEKNCGNCGNQHCGKLSARGYECVWQPKKPEPHNSDVSKNDKLIHSDTQGWEERFEKEYASLYVKYTDSITQHFCTAPVSKQLKAFIRAVAEQEREREKAAILDAINSLEKYTLGGFGTEPLIIVKALEALKSVIESNGHRGEK